ncbi:translation initiation factor IF-2-like [Schistocerca americana]|uniref:translation initiation factor IF-2-like n=1 Tax=Schistocerca americana TaxID=7009 RepID=UPI001F50422C|nr:translation initiation factor IF-2-like [Schistocerca americana]
MAPLRCPSSACGAANSGSSSSRGSLERPGGAAHCPVGQRFHGPPREPPEAGTPERGAGARGRRPPVNSMPRLAGLFAAGALSRLCRAGRSDGASTQGWPAAAPPGTPCPGASADSPISLAARDDSARAAPPGRPEPRLSPPATPGQVTRATSTASAGSRRCCRAIAHFPLKTRSGPGGSPATSRYRCHWRCVTTSRAIDLSLPAVNSTDLTS